MGEGDKSVRSRNGVLRDDESGTKETDANLVVRRGRKSQGDCEEYKRAKEQEDEEEKGSQGETSLMPSLLPHFAACDDR